MSNDICIITLKLHTVYSTSHEEYAKSHVEIICRFHTSSRYLRTKSIKFKVTGDVVYNDSIVSFSNID